MAGKPYDRSVSILRGRCIPNGRSASCLVLLLRAKFATNLELSQNNNFHLSRGFKLVQVRLVKEKRVISNTDRHKLSVTCYTKVELSTC